MILKEYRTSDQGPESSNDQGHAAAKKGVSVSKPDEKKRPNKPAPQKERRPENTQRTPVFAKNWIIGADPQRKATGKNMMRLVIKSYDSHFLDSTARFMCEVLKKNDVRYSGPVPLPVSTRRFVVKSSPHVYKDARHRFEIRESARMLEFAESPSAISALSGVDSIHPSVTVTVKVKPAKIGRIDSKQAAKGGEK